MRSTEIRRKARLLGYRLLPLLAVLGPGIITANVDNDPGGILTYSQAGAKFGYALLWTIVPTTIALVVVQEMSARMGAVTGKGLSDLIREEFGLRVTFFTMVVFGLADLGTIAAEFAGVASGMGLFGVSKYISIPIAAVLVWALIVYGSYQPVERLLLIFSLVYLAYPVSAFMAHPDWHVVLHQSVTPGMFHSSEYFVMVVGLIGTTITPWMQFYLQASIVEKGVSEREYRISRWDVILGCLMTEIVTFFIIVACGATLYVSGLHDINDAADAAAALKPLAGDFASLLFAVGLVNAGVLSAAILPLATTYNICEGLGFESGINHRIREAPAFYSIYSLLVLVGAAIVLIPGIPLIKLILLSQVANGVLLPFVLFYMLKLVNRPDLMRSHTNSKLGNAIAITTSIIMVVLTVAMIWTTVSGK